VGAQCVAEKFEHGGGEMMECTRKRLGSDKKEKTHLWAGIQGGVKLFPLKRINITKINTSNK